MDFHSESVLNFVLAVFVIFKKKTQHLVGIDATLNCVGTLHVQSKT